MRSRPSILAALLATSTVALARIPINADDASDDRQELVTKVYSIADLPVWSSVDGEKAPQEFDPHFVAATIKATIDPQSWQSGESSLRAQKATLSLVVRTTETNHRGIARLLEAYRRERNGHFDEKQQAVSAVREYERLRTGVHNTIFRAERLRENDPADATAMIDAEIQNVESAELTAQQKSPLLTSLNRFREYLTTGEYPENESAEKSGAYEPMHQGSHLDPWFHRYGFEQFNLSRRDGPRVVFSNGLDQLADRLMHPMPPNAWPSYKEWDVPDDRDFRFGGDRLTR